MCECETQTIGDVLEGDALLEQLPPEMLLRNGYPQFSQGVVEQGLDRNAMAVPFTIVTRQKDVNRNGSKVLITPDKTGGGILLDNYRRNPVILLDHGERFALPIGVSEDQRGNLTVKLSKTKATAVAYFSQVLPEAVQVFALIDEGILRTASISFRPLKGILLSVDDDMGGRPDSNGVLEFKPWVSFDFTESDMLEWSVVSIPADPDAVKKHLDRGHINGERITQGMRPAMLSMCQQGDCGDTTISLADGTTDPVVPQADQQQVDSIQQSGKTTDLASRIAAGLQIERAVRSSVCSAFAEMQESTR